MEANLHHQAISLKNNGSITTNSRTIQEAGQNPLKRKSSESDCDLDLNLSLKIRPKDDELVVYEKGLEGHEEVLSSTLSLSLSSTSSLKLSRVKEKGGDDQDRKQARRMATSTFDLTL